MSKKTTDELVEAITPKKRKTKTSKEGGKMKKINFETAKTVLIFVLITAIIAFVGGMRYQQRYEKAVEVKAQAIAKQQASAKVETSKPAN